MGQRQTPSDGGNKLKKMINLKVRTMPDISRKDTGQELA